jgi:hypothetical protein
VTEARRPKEAAKKSDASHAIQAPRVFEDAEYFGAKFESFWNNFLAATMPMMKIVSLHYLLILCPSLLILFLNLLR